MSGEGLQNPAGFSMGEGLGVGTRPQGDRMVQGVSPPPRIDIGFIGSLACE